MERSSTTPYPQGYIINRAQYNEIVHSNVNRGHLPTSDVLQNKLKSKSRQYLKAELSRLTENRLLLIMPRKTNIVMGEHSDLTTWSEITQAIITNTFRNQIPCRKTWRYIKNN